MRVRSKFTEFLVKHDLLPVKFKWRKAASGVGRLFCDVFNLLDEDGRREFVTTLYDWGRSDVSKVIDMLGDKETCTDLDSVAGSPPRLRDRE